MALILDISHHQPSSLLDYRRISEQIDGIILRCAYGSLLDREWENHYYNFNKLGVPIGTYHFLTEYHPYTKQVETFLGAIDGKDLPLGWWTDVEYEAGAMPLTRSTVENYIELAEQKSGLQSDFYSSRNYWDLIMKTSQYASRKFWVAHYGVTSPLMPKTGGWKKWWLWQHTSHGRLDSYVGDLDLNYFWGESEDYNDWVGEDVIPTPEPDKPMYKVEVVRCVALTIRENPYVANNVVGYLKDGDIVDVFKEQNNWLRIDRGWISAAYTQRIEEIPPAQLTLEERVADNTRRIETLEAKM